jgi:hypothetical protein
MQQSSCPPSRISPRQDRVRYTTGRKASTDGVHHKKVLHFCNPQQQVMPTFKFDFLSTSHIEAGTALRAFPTQVHLQHPGIQ